MSIWDEKKASVVSESENEYKSPALTPHDIKQIALEAKNQVRERQMSKDIEQHKTISVGYKCQELRIIATCEDNGSVLLSIGEHFVRLLPEQFATLRDILDSIADY